MEKSKKWMLAAILFCGASVFTACTSVNDDNPAPATPENEQTEAVDYSDDDNWLRKPEATKDVDVFFIYCTEYNDDSKDAPMFAAIDEPAMRLPVANTYLTEGTVFEDDANVFAPWYRQCNQHYMSTLPVDVRAAALNTTPKTDLFAALDYFFENLNNGRPFILASHSQGSILMSFVLAEYMKAHPEYLKRMIAAYVIGYSITEDYLKANPHLKFAEGADDTGVIVSWNTEGAGNEGKNNTVVLPGSICINPLNWKRDETYASAEENLGGYLQDEKTGEIKFVPNAADAKVNLKRGVVITTTKAIPAITYTDIFGPDSYHEWDYNLYYNNIKANAKARIAAYLNSAK